SKTAVERVRARADELGFGCRVTAEAHDLARSFPSGTFDLVSAQDFHTPFRVAPRSGAAHYATPGEIAAELALDPEQWPVLRADLPRRRATGPGGRTAIVTDHVLLILRAGA